MDMEKRNYVKPYTAIVKVQTEGVIASSIISIDQLCNDEHDLFDQSCKNNYPNEKNYWVSQCNTIKKANVGDVFATCNKNDNNSVYHLVKISKESVELKKCDCNLTNTFLK